VGCKPLLGFGSGYRCKSGTGAWHMASPGFSLYPAAFQQFYFFQHCGHAGHLVGLS
jgi:hypothetical protein